MRAYHTVHNMVGLEGPMGEGGRSGDDEGHHPAVTPFLGAGGLPCR